MEKYLHLSNICNFEGTYIVTDNPTSKLQSQYPATGT